MFRFFIRTIVGLMSAIFRSRSDPALENLALRQQLAIFKDKRPLPRLDNPARAFRVGLRSAWPSWMDALILLSLEKDAPAPRAETPRPSPVAKVVALPRVGGLHHRYEWSEVRRAA